MFFLTHLGTSLKNLEKLQNLANIDFIPNVGSNNVLFIDF